MGGQAANLGIQFVHLLLMGSLLRVYCPVIPSEQATQALQGNGLPLVQLRRMHAVLGCDLGDGLLFLQNLLHDLGLEVSAKVFSHGVYYILMSPVLLSELCGPSYYVSCGMEVTMNRLTPEEREEYATLLREYLHAESQCSAVNPPTTEPLSPGKDAPHYFSDPEQWQRVSHKRDEAKRALDEWKKAHRL